MALPVGTRIGVYEVTGTLGAGGMGEVYRARDGTLQRDVALKVLPEAFALDPDRLARFRREAQVLAALNHPNIAAIYGFEESTRVHALVLELVEGPTLADMIVRRAGPPGPAGLPLDEALPIARQIAEALEAAHEHGIIHRDLKPANIKLRPDGTVKVLDFGLAKLADPADVASGFSRKDMTASPTITSPAMMTGVGMILGTAAYMSPEQAKGRAADKRTDIWAFGAVLYEMLTGERAFMGDDIADTLANVLKSDPKWSALPAATPLAVRTLLRRCLTKDRTRRLDSAADARLEIDDALTMPAPEASFESQGPSPVGWRRLAFATLAALVLGATATGTGVWLATRPAPLRVIRTAISTTAATALSMGTAGPFVTVTPDGSRIVYRSASGIAVRALDQLEPTLLTGEPNVQGLFTSPDGQWVGFFDGASLKKVAITGGAAVTVVTPLDGPGRGAAWGTDGTIVFSTGGIRGLKRVSADGGEVTVLTTPDGARGEADHLWPQFLPDGDTVLFTITATNRGLDAAQTAMLDLRTRTWTVLLREGLNARYVASGHLVYGTSDGLRAVAFDLERLAVVGSPVPVLSSVAMNAFGGIEAAVAGDGTLTYIPGGTYAPKRTLVWVDRQGREEPIPIPARSYQQTRLSPDGKQVALSSADEERDLWIWDFARKRLTRATFDPGPDQAPVWMPDSRRLVFSSERNGSPDLYTKSADGSGVATLLSDLPSAQFATGVAPEGTRVVFYVTTPAQARDLQLLTLGPMPQTEPLVATRFDERNGVVSPDGRWLAYESNSSDRFEIQVRPFPVVGDDVWHISTGGGVQPLWLPITGRELFYLAPDGALMGVAVDASSAGWSAGTPTRLLEGRYFTGAGNILRHYDVSADGKRFLMIKEEPSVAGASPSIIVVQNWTEELKRLVPVN